MAEKEYIEREKRYIEISKLPNFEAVYGDGKRCLILPFEHLYDIPAADVVEVVRCKDCLCFELMTSNNQHFCNQFGGYVTENDYCSRYRRGAKMDGKGEG